MPQIINTNLASLNAQRNLNKSQDANAKALQRLSSGLRINSAKDDAAGLAISTRFTTQVKGLNVAIRNAGDGVALAQTAEGALNSVTSSLQRIRELALQSANATNTDVDRASLQAEVAQLQEDIKSVSMNTNFNGRKLLDGSFGKATFQTGANVGENITIALGGARVDQLGRGVSAGVSTVTSNGTDRTASMAAGDLIINGVAVGAAQAAADGASTVDTDKSSIAIAAAINEVSSRSGVTAIVNANTVQGSDVTTAGVSATTVTLEINGVAMDLGGSGDVGNLLADLRGVASQINLYSGQTGVTASIDEDNLAAGVMLTAADGRNIDLDADASSVGVGGGAAETYYGSVSLVSKDGTAINISSTTGKSLENVGIESGSYSGSNAVAAGGTLSGTAMAAGDLVVNGVAIGASFASYDNASSADKSLSAISVATAINKMADRTGVSAKAAANTVTSTGVTADTGASITINGIDIEVADGTTGTTAEQVALYVDAINAKTAQTGVRAEVNDENQFTLVADDGRNITTASVEGVTDDTYYGAVQLISGDQIKLSTNTGDIDNSGFKVGTFGGASSGQLVKDIDISTKEGAEKALGAIDNALASVNTQRANLGAIQNRFDATISNLQENSENLSAANSRILDADFAAETASLSRAQVLQQAGISILAQANALSQNVLSLLR